MRRDSVRPSQPFGEAASRALYVGVKQARDGGLAEGIELGYRRGWAAGAVFGAVLGTVVAVAGVAIFSVPTWWPVGAIGAPLVAAGLCHLSPWRHCR